MKRRTKFVAAFLAIAMLFSVIAPILPLPVLAAPAVGEEPAVGGNYMIVSKRSGKAMTVAGNSTANSADIVQRTAEGYASQVWTIQDGGNGYFIFVNYYSQKAMNVPNNSVEEGTQMIQWNNDRSDNEQWLVTETTDGYYRITPKLVDTFCLNVEGNSTAENAGIIQWTYSGTDNEKWSFVPVDTVLDNPLPEEFDEIEAIDNYIEQFFYVENGLGKLYNMPSNGFWTDAEVLEVFIDAYERIGDQKYLTVAEQFYDGIIDRRSEDWSWNDYNDDVFWMTLATIRLYKNTGNDEYLRVAKANFDMCYERAWDTSFMGGGFWWRTDNQSKNGCVNGPGAFCALFIYETTGDEKYLNIAIEVMEWEIENLFNEETGQHYDNINIDGEINYWTNTGNQGNIIGPCTMLYKITGEEKYFNYAKKAADHAATLGDGGDELLNEGANSGDTIGGKGQLGRWLGYFMRECGVDDYEAFMYANAQSAWNNRNSDGLMWGEFGKITVEDIKNTTNKMANTNLNMKDYAAWGCSAAVAWLLGTPKTVESWTVSSPDGNTEMTVNISNGGKLTYTAVQDGVTVVESSDLGMVTSIGDFTTGLTYQSQENVEINETYNVISGKMSAYTNHCNQKTLHFVKESVGFDLVVRAYDDGIAFRYIITTENGQEMTVEPNAEITSFNLPNASQIWYMNRTANDFMYENEYESATIGEVAAGLQPSMPMLYETSGKYGLIMEADRHGTYVGSLLRLEDGGVMRTIFDLVQTTAVNTNTPFTSPWRTVIIGSAADIMMNTMVENLSPAPDPSYDFESWVEPGLSSWSWVSYYGGQTDPDIHKKFIDLAADMGWKYYILDEQWQPGSNTAGSRYEGMWDWFEDVRDYANDKGVKLVAWVHMDDVDTDEEREARFKEWSEAGIVGIKVDFFYNESQEILQLHDDIYADAAKYKLLVNVHGSNPSSGEIRTYPNIITREAIRGQEQGGIKIEQYTLIPFLRAAVGSADVTEQLYSRDTGKTTMGFQIALSTLIQNGLHSMGSKPEEYYSIPAAVSYYTNFPATWDDMYVLEDLTAVGEEVNLARKSGDAWYAAGISVNAADYNITPLFLDASKTYTAIIYQEVSGDRQNIEMHIVENVTVNTTLPTIHVASGGGYAIRFIPQGDSDLESIVANPSKVTVAVYDTASIIIKFDPEDTKATDLIWTVADPAILQVSPGGKGAIIKGMKAGTTTVTVTSVYDNSIQAVVNVTVTPGRYIFDDETWEVFNDNFNYVISGEDEVTISAEQGVIDNNIFAMEATDENFEITARISGGLNANYQGGFIGVFDADCNPYVSIGRRYHTMFTQNGSNNLISMMSNNSEQYLADPNADGYVYVRLVKNGNNFTGYYRVNATDAWTEAFTLTNAALAASDPLYVGFYAGCGGSTNGIDITFTDFTYNGVAVNVANKNPDAFEGLEIIEAEDMVLGGIANIVNDESVSNGQYVGNIGGADNGNISVEVVSEMAGKATVSIFYATWEVRPLALTVNGNTYALDCLATGNWNQVGEPIEVEVDVIAGTNTIVLGGVDGAYGPNIDYIEVELPTEPETPSKNLSFRSASLTLQTNLRINYRVNRSLFDEVGYYNPYVVFEMNGVKTVVTNYSVEEDAYVFRFSDIGPKMMKDTVYATLYAEFDGVEYSSTTVEYSIATYCYNKLAEYESTTDPEKQVFRTLLVDLLNYGAAAQEYLDYKTDDLVNAELTETQKSWGTADIEEPETVASSKHETIEAPTVLWRSARLNLGDTVKLCFKFSADSIIGLSVKVTSGGDEWTIPSSALEATDDGYYDVLFDGLNARQMREPVYVTVYKNGVAVSNTLAYSIGSYANSKWESSNAELVTLVKEMMKYGDSAKAYFE